LAQIFLSKPGVINAPYRKLLMDLGTRSTNPQGAHRPIRVRILCVYPGTRTQPTLVDFEAAPELGLTPFEVDAEIMRRLVCSKEFALPRLAGQPLRFSSAAVREILVG
jgi:hypothetical protein